ncbi:hypothetical protein LEP1GSC088_2832 [Leptospira interrogans str. L1207]|nr:hypothetical protein LEP1GSC088_2832 [Leptospira interrogans str. L1207]
MSAQTVSKIEPISINLFLRNTPVSQMGFGLPLILGVKEPTYSLQVSGNSGGLIWKSTHTGIVFIQIKYVASGNNTSLSVVRTGTGTETILIQFRLMFIRMQTEWLRLPRIKSN